MKTHSNSEGDVVKLEFFDNKKQELGVLLNDVQKEAVLHEEGPLLLLASPGSGKTTTTIMRIGYLLEEKGIDPSRFLAVTFSKASAEDMLQRFEKFFPNYPSGAVHFSTIHSLAFEITRAWMRTKKEDYLLIEGSVDEKEMKSFKEEKDISKFPKQKGMIINGLYRQIANEFPSEETREALLSYIGYVKNRMVPVEGLTNLDMEFSLDLNHARDTYLAYETYKLNHKPRLVDYDDMLTLAYQALCEDDSLLAKYQSKFDYVMTDESQDNSLIQHEIVAKLVAKHKNLCVVADDDQTLYGFRGATSGYLLNFETIYPDAKILYMTQNYRSNKKIVDAANIFIKRVVNRFEKNMFTENPEGEDIKLIKSKSYSAQLHSVLADLKQEENLKECAVLFRNNSSSVPLVHLLHEQGIPFYVKDADMRFFRHFIVQDIQNWMRLSYNSNIKHVGLLGELRKRMSPPIQEKHLKELSELDPTENIWKAFRQSESIKFYYNDYFLNIEENIGMLKDLEPEIAIRFILDKLEYRKSLKKYVKFVGLDQEVVDRMIETLLRIASYEDTLIGFNEKLKILEKTMKEAKYNKHKNVITLSTMHSSKGLEFDKVWIIDCQDGQVPSKAEKRSFYLDGNKEALDEASRLFYVAMTRARKTLKIHAYKEKESKPSLFFDETERIVLKGVRALEVITKDNLKQKKKVATSAPSKKKDIPYVKYEVGLEIKHPKFGVGSIIAIENEKLRLSFERAEVGIKELNSMHCLTNGLLIPTVKDQNELLPIAK